MEKEIVDKILEILKRKQGFDIGVEKIANTWVIVNDDGELYLEFSLRSNMLIINEIRLKNKRVGTLTDIVDYFKNKSWGIYIISVLTEEMHSFCKKYSFKRQEGGIGYGNFIKKGYGE